MGWVFAAALIVGLAAVVVAGTERDDQRDEWRRSWPTLDGAIRAMEQGDDPPERVPFRPSPLVAHPWATGLGAGVLVLVVGSLVVIALNSERRSPPP